MDFYEDSFYLYTTEQEILIHRPDEELTEAELAEKNELLIPRRAEEAEEKLRLYKLQREKESKEFYDEFEKGIADDHKKKYP
jgi:hypothetical protein